MCFRPADGDGGGAQKCPECGKPIQMMAGIKMEKCPFCKADFSAYLNGEKSLDDAPGQAAPAVTPVAASVPEAPAAPKIQKTPGKPKIPTPSVPVAPGW